MKYYQENSKQYIDETFSCDMSEQYALFEKHLNNHIKILDIGFGSGRDMIYFASKGFEVTGIDITGDFIDNMKQKGYNVFHKAIENINFNNEFDCIWACASLLHVKEENIIDVFKKCYDSLKENGLMYCSFKYGTFKGIRNNRYYLDLDEESLNKIIDQTKFNLLETNITHDVRNNHTEKWINVILKK